MISINFGILQNFEYILVFRLYTDRHVSLQDMEIGDRTVGSSETFLL